MQKRNKGFTLLEISVCFVLFAILLEALWGFFSNIYGEYMQFDKKVALNNEADAIEGFLRDYIRQADKIKITTQDGKVIEVILAPTVAVPLPNPNNEDVLDIELKEIEIEKKQLNAAGTAYEIKNSKVFVSNNTSPIGKQGRLKLSYLLLSGVGGSGVGSSKLISDQIENIKVTHKKDTDLVEITCTIHKNGETNNRLKKTFKFTEDLTYKERLS